MTFLTLLPFSNFAVSVASLEDDWLERQCCEALRLIHEVRGGSFEPSAQMWVGYEAALALYASLAILEWEARHVDRPLGHIAPYVVNPGYRQPGAESLFPNPRSEHLSWLPPLSEVVMPKWVGEERVHVSHRLIVFHNAPEDALVWP